MRRICFFCLFFVFLSLHVETHLTISGVIRKSNICKEIKRRGRRVLLLSSPIALVSLLSLGSPVDQAALFLHSLGNVLGDAVNFFLVIGLQVLVLFGLLALAELGDAVLVPHLVDHFTELQKGVAGDNLGEHELVLLVRHSRGAQQPLVLVPLFVASVIPHLPTNTIIAFNILISYLFHYRVSPINNYNKY